MKYCESACGGYGKSKDCPTCPNRPPDLMRCNIQTWRLWNYACTQWRVSMAGMTGIDWGAVMEIARALDVDITPAMMGALHKLEMFEIERMAPKNGE